MTAAVVVLVRPVLLRCRGVRYSSIQSATVGMRPWRGSVPATVCSDCSSL